MTVFKSSAYPSFVGVIMWNFASFLAVCVCIPFVTSLRGFLLGPGQWLVQNIQTCVNPEQYEIMIDIKSKKLNRTHDCFDGHFEFDKGLNIEHGVDIEIYQEVDGGYKYYQTMYYDSFCKLLFTVAKENTQRAFILGKIDPPNCPIPAGPMNIKNFVMNYKELPLLGVYGTFEARTYIIYNKKKVGCMRIFLNFEIRNDDD